jgi:hypothetical protein
MPLLLAALLGAVGEHEAATETERRSQAHVVHDLTLSITQDGVLAHHASVTTDLARRTVLLHQKTSTAC